MNLGKVMYFCSILFSISLLFTQPLRAEPVAKVRAKPVLDHAWRKTEYPPGFFSADLDNGNPRIYQEVDILHYTIDAKFFLGDPPYPDNAYLEAVTTIDGQAKAETLDELIIDFYDNITINSFKLNDIEFSNYTRLDNRIWMDLSSDPLDPSEAFEITVDYTRIYGGDYQGIMFRQHPPESGTPAICSIDQPYLSPAWWPCFDYPSDKATADIYMTYPDWMTAVSNGLLQSEVDNGDETKTSHWREDYQAYTCALSVAMTDYVTWGDTYISPLDGTTTMPLVYYAFPEDAAKAMVDYDVTKDALIYYAQIYGEYPFINEKYGIAETPNSHGSLEHQTITSLTYRATQSEVNWDVIVHELAHQWWGDWVTCKTWNHLWLHEGFATYSEVLFNEHDTGEPAGPFMAVNYDDGLYDGYLRGTVYTEDEHLFNPFFEIGAVYEKAAWVLHMLRHMMGDTSFFNAVKAYGQAHAHSTAVTNDLKAAMEAEYGSSLVDFFNQWVYTPYRPIYSIIYENSSSGGYKVYINVRQTQPHSVQDVSQTPLRDYYIMPIDFTVHYVDETTQTFSVNSNQRNQSFQLPTSKEPDYTVFDEGSNILKVAEEQIADNDGIPNDGDNNGIPGDNPCTGGVSENCDDNCPDTFNGPDVGTCVKTKAGMVVSYRVGDPKDFITCTSDADCEATDGTCQMEQGDCNSNGCGDVCECYMDCNNSGAGDGKVTGSDLAVLKQEYGRFDCSEVDPCYADGNEDGKVTGADLSLLKNEYGRFDCPACP